MPRRVTLQEIADTLGLSRSTVSRALHNSPRLPQSTRDRVQREAMRLGYRPHPAHRYLSDCRWRRPESGLVIAIVIADRVLSTQLHDSIKKEASLLGYGVAIFNIHQGQGAKLHKTLQARGIRGLILAWDSYSAIEDDFPFEQYAIVLARPRNDSLPFVTVRHNPFEGITMLLRVLYERQYRRIGLCMWREAHSQLDDRTIGGWAAFLDAHPDVEHLPPFKFTREEFRQLKRIDGHPIDCPQFARWMERHQPDAVLGFNPLVYWWLQYLGYRMPEDVGFVEIERLQDEELRQVGIIAVNQLDLLLRQHRYGPQSQRIVIVTEPCWIEFPTVRPLDSNRVTEPYPPKGHQPQEPALGSS